MGKGDLPLILNSSGHNLKNRGIKDKRGLLYPDQILAKVRPKKKGKYILGGQIPLS